MIFMVGGWMEVDQKSLKLAVWQTDAKPTAKIKIANNNFKLSCRYEEAS